MNRSATETADKTAQQRDLLLSLLLLAALIALAFYIGRKGIDYGSHWDEPRLISAVADSVHAGRWLPGWYNYPSVAYDLALVGLLLQAPADQLHAIAVSPAYWLNTRLLFLFVSLLSAVWIYFAALEWHGRPWQALLAAAIFLGSWEMGYHARWIAPDGLVMQFAALTLLLLTLAWRRQRSLWLALAAIAAALTTGAKYPGGVMLLPVLLLHWRQSERPLLGRLLGLLPLLLIFALTFLLTTPGAIADFAQFQADLRFEMTHYAAGHGGYTVASPLAHLGRLLIYLALVLFAPARLPALLFALLALLGAAQLLSPQRRGWGLIFLSAPLLYTLYMGTRNVMIVRNYLLLLPFLTLLAADGFTWLWQRLPQRALRASLLTVVVAALSFSTIWQLQAAATIVAEQQGQLDHAANVQAYLEQHADITFYLSGDIFSPDIDLRQLPNVSDDPAAAGVYIFTTSSVYGDDSQPLRWMRWPVNRLGYYDVVSGAREVNWDYYSTWRGGVTIVAVPLTAAAAAGLYPPFWEEAAQ